MTDIVRYVLPPLNTILAVVDWASTGQAGWGIAALGWFSAWMYAWRLV